MADKRKAKFRVGQIVRVRCDNAIVEIGSMNWDGRWCYWDKKGSSIGWLEKELRALNAVECPTLRERGELR